ncbi:MAG: threonine aldolase family protein [Angustibacter sp.]
MIDLRSDTVTRPTNAMRAAMAAAEVGDEVFDEDPTVDLLEQTVAELLGHEAALFTGSGSLANQLGLRVLVEPGSEVLCDAQAHVVRAELGAAAMLGGITTRTWSSDFGDFRAADALELMVPDAGPYLVSTGAIAVENTHNFGGGTVQSLAQARELRAGVLGTPVRLHLDGARLWNAHMATGESLLDWGRLFDTVSVCLSKGLGAPVGSVLVGSAERMAQARVWRKRLGGGLRQVGLLAAAGLYALEHNLARLPQDHRLARLIAQACSDARPESVQLGRVTTNIVLLDLRHSHRNAPDLVAEAAAAGVLVLPFGLQAVRVVTHLDVSPEQAERAAGILAGLVL